jgi:oligopeptide transport system substrate-binding protein
MSGDLYIKFLWRFSEMNKTFRKVLCALLVVCMLFSVTLALTSCGDNGEGRYSYKSYTTALGNNWNPHTWETNADDSILSYISSPFVTMEAKDTENGVYQWVYEMATAITDVTATHQADLTKYGVTLPAGKTASDVTSGYVFEIKLNPDAKWENGELITADDYIYSMQQLLNSKMRNYRANLYVSGESALAGAAAYYNSEAPIYSPVVPAYGSGETPDYSYDIDANKVYINVTSGDMTFADYTIKEIAEDYGFIKDVKDDAGNVTVPGYTYYKELAEAANAYGYTEVTAENKDKVLTVLDQYCGAFGISIYNEDKTVNNEYFKEFLFYNSGVGEKVEYDKVGCYKVDDYTIVYVCQTAIDYNYFLTSCTSTWLVYEDLYEKGKDTSGELVTTNYGTSKKTSMSYGVYKISSLQAEKQIVFVQNDQWYGWQKDATTGDLAKDEEGNLISYTTYHKNIDGEAFKVDGKELRQHQISRVVIDVMDEASAKQAFLQGKLSDWSPSADELSTYAASDRLYKVDETYTMSFFFNTSVAALKEMDASKGNTNSVVLSNINFRKAFSLAIDRAEFVTATEGYKPAFALMNNLYYYDFYNDPTSSYRNTDQAMEAICNLYGVKWGEGTPYATLKAACDSITGYNLTEAKALMKTACDELVAAGLYTAGQEIKIRIGWSAGAIESAGQKQITLMNEYINAAIEGSGFGKITLEGVGNLEDRYNDVPNGNYAIGYGAWGGAALYPFRNFQVYMDPDQYDINEAACWDPTTEELTLTVGGEEVTMTWQEWSNSMMGTGVYVSADNETKLTITSMLETKYLEKYYRIPLAGTTICSMLSYQLSYYTEEYNMAYGFGGSRLMTFAYDDAEWAAFVKEQGGKLSYE